MTKSILTASNDQNKKSMDLCDLLDNCSWYDKLQFYADLILVTLTLTFQGHSKPNVTVLLHFLYMLSY